MVLQCMVPAAEAHSLLGLLQSRRMTFSSLFLLGAAPITVISQRNQVRAGLMAVHTGHPTKRPTHAPSNSLKAPTLPRNTTVLQAVAHLRYSSMTNSLPSPVEVAERELGSTPTPYGTICSPVPNPKSSSLSSLKQPKLLKAAAAALETAQMAAHSLKSTSSSPVLA